VRVRRNDGGADTEDTMEDNTSDASATAFTSERPAPNDPGAEPGLPLRVEQLRPRERKVRSGRDAGLDDSIESEVHSLLDGDR
jgi:hypothetical protein